MRLSILLLVLAVAGTYSCQKKSTLQLATSVKFEQQNFEEALVLAQQQNKLLMVDFWSAG